jgi:methylenetetrahydrofolate reductase (NADPH)
MPGDRSSRGELLAAGEPSFSFEFFPPKTDEGERLLWQAHARAGAAAPVFVSVTYGAGGSTRDRTVRITGGSLAETTLPRWRT